MVITVAGDNDLMQITVFDFSLGEPGTLYIPSPLLPILPYTGRNVIDHELIEKGCNFEEPNLKSNYDAPFDPDNWNAQCAYNCIVVMAFVR